MLKQRQCLLKLRQWLIKQRHCFMFFRASVLIKALPRKITNYSSGGDFSFKMFGRFAKKLYFCRHKLNQYFYGYYFYFASNCEAGRCV